MRAREWTIAGIYETPAEHDIPPLPTWQVCQEPCGRLTLSGDTEGAYIVAGNPVRVRR